MIDVSNPPEGHFVYKAQVFFDQLDYLKVMHHSRYLLHLERASMTMFDHIMETTGFDPDRYPDVYAVVRHIEIDYLKPIDGLIEFLVIIWVERLREAGLTTGFEFRSADGKDLFCKGTRTVCRMSSKTRQPTSWSPVFRERYGKWEACIQGECG